MSDAVTLAQGTAHNPAEPRHFMKIKPVEGVVQIVQDGEVLAESNDALRLLEVGRDLYDPVLYLPRGDVRADLVPFERSTHCPLKGDASYLARSTEDAQPIAWSYVAPLDFASAIAGRVAFDTRQVEVRIRPA